MTRASFDSPNFSRSMPDHRIRAASQKAFDRKDAMDAHLGSGYALLHLVFSSQKELARDIPYPYHGHTPLGTPLSTNLGLSYLSHPIFTITPEPTCRPISSHQILRSRSAVLLLLSVGVQVPWFPYCFPGITLVPVHCTGIHSDEVVSISVLAYEYEHEHKTAH